MSKINLDKGLIGLYSNTIWTYLGLMVIATCLIVIAGFRSIGFDRDSLNYLESFLGFQSLLDSDYLNKEPGFWLIVWLSNLIFGSSARPFFIIYASLGVLITFSAVKKLTCHPILAIFCYIFLYFPLHGMTQIRAGLACAIFLSSIPNAVDRKLLSFVIKLFLAAMVHYFAIVFFAIYFLKAKTINVKFYLSLPFIGLFFVLFRNELVRALSSFAPLLPDFIGYKLLIYIELLQDDIGAEINLFSAYYISLFAIYYYSVLSVDKFTEKYDYVFIKLLGWALFGYYMLSFLPAIAVRVSELYGVVIIFIIPMLVYSFKEKIVPLILSAIFLLLIFINNVFLHNLFNF